MENSTRSGFRVNSEYQPTGDQPQAIEQLASGLDAGLKAQTLLGVTGSGKTHTMARVIEQAGRPALVIAHNKTLAAQLASEFAEFFPNNAVEYFVSYYDYYQPEAYVPLTDTFIEKDAQINEDIDRLRHSATSLFTRRDVIVVASVSAIYGLGSPEEYRSKMVLLEQGGFYDLDDVLRDLVKIQYTRNDFQLNRGNFRVRGDVLEVHPAYQDTIYRISFFGDEVENMTEADPLTGEVLREHDTVTVYPATHFVTGEDRLAVAVKNIEAEAEERVAELEGEGKVLEAYRLKQRTQYDLEMMRELGYTSGIENYSRHLDGRPPGSTPYTLLDYFPDDYITFVDESHITLPQVRGMYNGDRSRKTTLVEFGFRLPSALDNRPLMWDELLALVGDAGWMRPTPPVDHDVVGDQRHRHVVAQRAPHLGLDAVVDEVADLDGIVGQIVLRARRRPLHLAPELRQGDVGRQRGVHRAGGGQRVLAALPEGPGHERRLGEDLQDLGHARERRSVIGVVMAKQGIAAGDAQRAESRRRDGGHRRHAGDLQPWTIWSTMKRSNSTCRHRALGCERGRREHAVGQLANGVVAQAR